MHKRLILGMLLLAAYASLPQRSMSSTNPSQPEMISATSDFRLENQRWHHRIILVFAPSEESLLYQNQRQQWAIVSDAMRERDLKLVEVFTTGQSRVDGQPINRESGDRLRKHFGIEPAEFAIVLVGKDGTEKQRETAPTNPTVFFRTIDAMPMRQQEMRSNARE